MHSRPAAAVAMLAQAVPLVLTARQIDRTGLTGGYDLDIKFEPDEIRNRADRSEPVRGPSFAQALEEQLGLRLEPTRAPVPVIVVVSVERPAEN
jgi:uncharacterized protein (TIGR03435 family)